MRREGFKAQVAPRNRLTKLGSEFKRERVDDTPCASDQAVCTTADCNRAVASRLKCEVFVEGCGAVDHGVPGAGGATDALQCVNWQIAVRALDRLKDLQHVMWVVINALQRLFNGLQVNTALLCCRRVGDGAS